MKGWDCQRHRGDRIQLTGGLDDSNCLTAVAGFSHENIRLTLPLGAVEDGACS